MLCNSFNSNKKELPDEVLDTVADAALMDIEGYLK